MTPPIMRISARMTSTDLLAVECRTVASAIVNSV
jgi:hypothetical protein